MLDWRKLLSVWSTQLMATELAERVDPPPPDPTWLGLDPAPEETIRALEDRLGVTLPPSYRAFLAVSDGWRRTTPFIDRIRPAADVDWFRVENASTVELCSQVDLTDPEDSQPPDEELYTYPDGSSEPTSRRRHLRWLLQISDYDDGLYLLSPEAVTPDGEWEAWFFADWIPWERRYPSFAHMMLGEYRSFATLEDQPIPADLPNLPILGPEVPRTPAPRRQDPETMLPSLDSLIEQMRTQQGKPLTRAITQFFDWMANRLIDGQRPDLTRTFIDLFRSTPDPRVRCACLVGIRRLAGPDVAPNLVLRALKDPDRDVVLNASQSQLGRSAPDPRALLPLRRFLRSHIPASYKDVPMAVLGKIGDQRAAPLLRKILRDEANHFDRNFESAGRALGGCGEAGFAVLEANADHSHWRVRRGVAIGLANSRHPRAAEVLARLAHDPNPEVAAQARGD